jgi:hypothetical protein
MVVHFEMNLSWKDLIRRTGKKTMTDDAQGLASQLAYYFFGALSRAPGRPGDRELFPITELHR